MRTTKRAVMLLTAAVLAGVAAPAPTTAQPTNQAGIYEIRVCNRTGYNAAVAISYQPVGYERDSSRWYNEGWFVVKAGTCENLRQTNNAYFYGYAETHNSDEGYWGGDLQLCLSRPGPYAFWRAGEECAAGQDLVGFQTMHATQRGVFTWNLDM